MCAFIVCQMEDYRKKAMMGTVSVGTSHSRHYVCVLSAVSVLVVHHTFENSMGK